MSSLLRITDGTTTVDLLQFPGWLLKDWKPSVADPKGGGIFKSSPLIDGRKLAYRKMDNVTDTFNMVSSGGSMDSHIQTIQKLQRLLEKATEYWTSNWQNEVVWIEARGPNETQTRYAPIVDYRLTGFGNPYSTPFFDCDNSASEAILVIEHTFWQETEPGEAGTCVQASSLFFDNAASVVSNTYYSGQNSDDGSFSIAGVGPEFVDLTSDAIQIGHWTLLEGECQAGIVFPNVALANSLQISKAELFLYVDYPPPGTDCDIIVGGFIGSQSTFSTVLDFRSRVRGNGYTTFHIPNGTFSCYINITNVIQTIIDDPSWSSGDDLGIYLIFIQPNNRFTLGFGFCSYEAGAPFRPSLTIEYSAGMNVGQEATCNHTVMVSNKQNRAAITHVFYYDQSGGTYSSNLMEEALPYSLFPATPASGDMLYIGSSTAMVDGGRFNNVVFDLSQALEGFSIGDIFWEYCDGSPYQEFNILGGNDNELCGDALVLGNEGVSSIVFKETSDDWQASVVNGVTGYWIRFHINAGATGTAQPPIQQNRHIYTTVNPYIDIDAAQVPGDIPALSRILFDSAACDMDSMNTLVVGLRSLSRGEDFTAYLNASDMQEYPGINFSLISGIAGLNMIDYKQAPTGRAIYTTGFQPYAALTALCKWEIFGNLASQYLGVYHAYVRCQMMAEAAGLVKFRLRCVYGEEFNVSYSETNVVTDLAYHPAAIDLGQFSILPSMTFRPNDVVNKLTIYLDSYGDDTFVGYANGCIFDVVLIPADEWSGNFGTPKSGAPVISYGYGLDIDGITNPRQMRATETSYDFPSAVYTDVGRKSEAEWTKVSSGVPILQANEDQRLWFLQYQYDATYGLFTHFQDCGRVCVQRSARYLLARGSR